MALPATQFAQGSGVQRIVDGGAGSGQGAYVNQGGQQLVNVEGRKATYRGGILALAAAATPADIFTLTGSPLVVARLLMVEVWIGATAAVCSRRWCGY